MASDDVTSPFSGKAVLVTAGGGTGPGRAETGSCEDVAACSAREAARTSPLALPEKDA
jgi:hypothetical protein